jgi:hypothetical protein
MTKDEFSLWFHYHCSRFVGVRAWLDKTTHGTDAPTEAEILSGWFGVLKSVQLSDAKAASDRLNAASPDELPRGYDRHPSVIAAMSRTSRQSRQQVVYDGQHTVRCRECQDTGFVMCWEPVDLKRLADGNAAVNGRGVAVPCSCECGGHHVPIKCRTQPSRYTPKAWCKLAWLESDNRLSMPIESDPIQQANAIDWLRDHKPANFEAAFEEFT